MYLFLVLSILKSKGNFAVLKRSKCITIDGDLSGTKRYLPEVKKGFSPPLSSCVSSHEGGLFFHVQLIEGTGWGWGNQAEISSCSGSGEGESYFLPFSWENLLPLALVVVAGAMGRRRKRVRFVTNLRNTRLFATKLFEF